MKPFRLVLSMVLEAITPNANRRRSICKMPTLLFTVIEQKSFQQLGELLYL